MNRRQRIAIFVGSVVIATMLLFPPMSGIGHPAYLFVFSNRSVYIEHLDFQRKTGKFDPEFNGWFTWHINRERLFFQVLIALVLTAGITVLLGKRE
jgi:hypothetical protein